jgi:hypothetical protein
LPDVLPLALPYKKGQDRKSKTFVARGSSDKKFIITTSKFGGDLESMMKRGKAKRTKGDTINNENNYRHQLSPLP